MVGIIFFIVIVRSDVQTNKTIYVTNSVALSVIVINTTRVFGTGHLFAQVPGRFPTY